SCLSSEWYLSFAMSGVAGCRWFLVRLISFLPDRGLGGRSSASVKGCIGSVEVRDGVPGLAGDRGAAFEGEAFGVWDRVEAGCDGIDGWTEFGREWRQGLHVEAVELRGGGPEHLLDFVALDSCEGVADGLAGVRVGALVVGEVAAPHDA